MFLLRRNAQRQHRRELSSSISQTFFRRDRTSLAGGFARLLRFDEHQIPPGGLLPKEDTEADVFTYVHKGVIAQQNANVSNTVRAGDFQCMAGGVSHDQRNVSPTDWVHLFRLRIERRTLLHGDLQTSSVQERFTTAQRHNTLCPVASPSGANGSLALNSDAYVYSSILDLGYHLVHELMPSRCVWLHIVSGGGQLGDLELAQGDGVGIAGTRAISLTVREDSEILLVDLAGDHHDDRARAQRFFL